MAAESLLNELSSQKDIAFSGDIPNVVLLQEIVSRLNALSQEDKSYFSDFVTILSADLFTAGITLNTLDIGQYKKITDPVQESETVSTKEFKKAQADFNELLRNLILALRNHVEILKNYFIIKLENNPEEDYKLLVLYDSTYFIKPIKKMISPYISDVIFKMVDDFSAELDGGQWDNKNVLCFILLVSRANDNNKVLELQKQVTTIVDSYKLFEYFSLKENALSGERYISERSVNKDDFYDEIEFINATLLSNGLMKYEEEKIIKKLCRGFSTPLLIYRTLKQGNSGSTVIEVIPRKDFSIDNGRRYIIKYNTNNPERKVYNEYKSFTSFVQPFKGMQNYQCEYERTMTHEGLRYTYAISDTEQESFSFNDILSKKTDKFDANVVVDKLFQTPLYTHWQDSIEESDCKVSDLYEPYLKNFEDTFREVALILNSSFDDVKSGELYHNFSKIWNSTLNVNKKVCHGDLHTENFFTDAKGIYLIDFGYTGEHHAIIDHVCLECSIKFKHVPFYVKLDELEKIEEELGLESAFQMSTRFVSTTRADVVALLGIIKNIRNNSLRLLSNKDNPILEYWISLFIMTFKQIKYRDLNQLYAYRSALILSKRIVQAIGG